MDASLYQKLAWRTANQNQTHKEALCNWLIGLSGEVGELQEPCKKYLFHGHELDIERIKKEASDVLWYIAAACTQLNIDMSEVMELNIEKLRKRYPEKFTFEQSYHDGE